MTRGPPIGLACDGRERRARLLGALASAPDAGPEAPNGLDAVEVSPDQRRLHVTFFGRVPAGLEPEQVRIEGGRRVTGIRAVAVEVHPARRDRDEQLVVEVDRPGDFSTYRLSLVEREGDAGPWRRHSALDPRYASLDFTFKLDCAVPEVDCLPAPCPSPAGGPPGPDISYLAKDYESFRALMLDRLALTLPEWRERHAPDLGITLVELLAYHADRLSYYQDAVGAEAYLATARRRSSVRRHLRLVGYRPHEGTNARSFVAVRVGGRLEAAPGQVAFTTRLPAEVAPPGRPVPVAALERLAAEFVWFEPLVADRTRPLVFEPAKNEFAIWTWGEGECCLPKGATRATLVAAPGLLARGDLLVFAEAKSPRTGRPEDADPTRRQAVRLTEVGPARDPLHPEVALSDVEWAPDDALGFALCVAVRPETPPCGPIEGGAVAFGNVVLVDVGRSVTHELGEPPETVEALCVCGQEVRERRVRDRWRPPLAHAPVTHAAPLDSALPARELLVQDPRAAVPALLLQEEGTGLGWVARHDLLASGEADRHVVLEPGAPPSLRFGDGRHGAAPAAGVALRARYRVGNGAGGNVAAEAITHLVVTDAALGLGDLEVRPRNPLPAAGGLDPEPLDVARRMGPVAHRHRLDRAITAEDYAEAARRHPGVQAASARLVWTGSWHAAVVSVDPLGAEGLAPALDASIEARLERVRRIGHDLAAVPARAVPLVLELLVCVAPGAIAGHVLAAVRERLGSGTAADGKAGFFHPDRLRPGATIAAAALVAEVMAVPDVTTCRIDKLARLHQPVPALPPRGVLRLEAHEVAQLAGDPSRPELGRLVVTAGGGR